MKPENTRKAGVALYLEYRRSTESSNYTTQLRVSPEHVLASGSQVVSTFFYRRITTATPRRQWRHVATPQTTAALRSTVLAAIGDRRGRAEAMENIAYILSNNAKPIFDQLHRNSYVLVGEPIYVEASEVDLASVRVGKIPYQLLNRVWKTRKALKYPTEFIGPLPAV